MINFIIGKFFRSRIIRHIINFLEKKYIDNFKYSLIKFKISRYCVMHGVRPPFPSSRGCDLNYWGSRTLETNHSPKQYLLKDISTERCLDKIISVSDKNTSFVEIGCNAGRNLNYLYENGFRNLAGIEINKIAIEETLRNYFPDLYKTGKFYIGNAADEIKKIPDNSFDVVFSIAVLIHINPEYMYLFEEMARISKRYISILTSENGYPFPYDFKKIFTKNNFKEIYYACYYGNVNNKFIPVELYDKYNHFYKETFVRIFIKNKEERK